MPVCLRAVIFGSETLDEFEGRVAVVTGGASGIGQALATRFAQEGMKVVIGDVEQGALDTAVTRLRQQEFDVHGVLTDVSDAASVEDLAHEAVERFGKVHILCNNAGIGGSRAERVWDATLKDWQWTLGVNLWGVIHGIRAFVPGMLAHGEPGHIVNTASMAGLVQGNRPYSVSKHAVVALSEALFEGLALENAKIGASVLCPGYTFTNLTSAERNRPEALKNASQEAPVSRSPANQERMQRVRQLTEQTGIAPERTAEIVLQAIRNNQFYILTHAEYDEVIRERMDNILTRQNPDPKGPGLTSMRPRGRDL
jgi:NAD(P)-dependent dehydrogenase (short-subunit alcohol dehydrogenase family)